MEPQRGRAWRGGGGGPGAEQGLAPASRPSRTGTCQCPSPVHPPPPFPNVRRCFLPLRPRTLVSSFRHLVPCRRKASEAAGGAADHSMLRNEQTRSSSARPRTVPRQLHLLPSPQYPPRPRARSHRPPQGHDPPCLLLLPRLVRGRISLRQPPALLLFPCPPASCVVPACLYSLCASSEFVILPNCGSCYSSQR